MTDLLLGRDLDLALAEVTDTRGCRYWWGGDSFCGLRSSDHTDPLGHQYDAPVFALYLIAAAEEPLRKAGWHRKEKMTALGDGEYLYEDYWYAPDARVDDDPVAYAEAPDEVTARGNALLRGLLKLKEEQG